MRIRRLFGHGGSNWSIKLLALAAAVLLFFYNRIVSLDEVEFNVPLEVVTSSELAIAEAYPDTVHVRVRGSEDAVDSVSEDDFVARADATRYTSPGRYQIGVSVRETSDEPEIRALDIRVEPMTIPLALDRRTSAEVQIEPNLSGRPARGYELTRDRVVPAEVVIEGPERYVEGRSRVSTEEIRIAGRDESFTARVPLEAPNDLLTFPGGETVEFRGTIEETTTSATLGGIDIEIIDLPDEFELARTADTGEAELRGPFFTIESLEPENMVMTANAGEIDEAGVYELPVLVDAPANVTVVEYEPTEVTVEAIELEPVEEIDEESISRGRAAEEGTE